MSIIASENFEGTGYQLTWTESVGSGCTIDEDCTTSEVSNPSGWSDQCLKIITADSVTNFAYTNVGTLPISYFRCEVIVHSYSGTITTNDTVLFLAAANSAFSNYVWRLYIFYTGGVGYFICNPFYDGNSHDDYNTATAITLDQKYVIEVQWDYTNGTYEFRIDGNQKYYGSITTGGEQVSYIVAGCPAATVKGSTVYFDNFAIDNTTWVTVGTPSDVSETFEGTGYVNSWTESVGSGCTIDEDSATSAIGSPSGWGDQCLKMVTLSNASNYALTGIQDHGVWYSKFEVIFTDLSAITSEGEGFCLFAALNAAASAYAWRFVVLQGGDGNKYFVASPWYDGTYHFDLTHLVFIALNTKYIVEVKWDVTGGAYEFRINGVQQSAGSITTGAAQQGTILIGETGTTSKGATYYVDNVTARTAGFVSFATAALTGTALGSITEADIVTGGKTIVVTLTGDTWIDA